MAGARFGAARGVKGSNKTFYVEIRLIILINSYCRFLTVYSPIVAHEQTDSAIVHVFTFLLL